MADRWMDDRERQMRDREGRRPDTQAREGWRSGSRSSEGRSWDDEGPGRYGVSGSQSYRGPSPRVGFQPYGRSPDYGDEARREIYRETYGLDGPGMASGGTGGYDYERGYGDGPDQGRPGGRDSFMHRAGERVGAWIRGDHPGHRGKGPSGYTRSDDRISDEVHDRLTDDPTLDASNIHVAVHNGEVTLSGTVESRDDKHHAEHLVEALLGVKHVQNNLRADPGSGRGHGEGVLEAQARGENPGAGPGLGRDRDTD